MADIEDAAWPSVADSGDLARRGVRSCLAVPLMVRDQVVGVLAVYATERGRFDEDDEALLAGFAGHAAAAVENSRLVQQLLHAERLAAVGRIVAGVAHELNNPLAVVIGTADLLRRETLESRIDERLRRISGQAQRAVKIVRSLLALARKQPTTWTTVDVNTLIEETLELEGYQFRSERVSVVRDLAPDLPGILADADQLQQVLTNLFLNALEAMRESRGHGTLTVSTRATGADRVTVTVADDGPGIAAGDLERVFEPFFTTKKEQKGTGLGLSICRQIVETHRGRIRVESRPGAGTTFTVELPISREGVERATEPDRVDGRPREGVPVLLVEDERVVGDLLAEFLTLEGHQVDRAANGREALDLVRRREYALIVSDVRMPDLDGPAFYRELGTVNPLLTRRMLFVTGDVMSPETRRFLDETRLAYLEKPFGLGEFHAAIRSVLDRQACSPRPASPPEPGIRRRRPSPRRLQVLTSAQPTGTGCDGGRTRPRGASPCQHPISGHGSGRRITGRVDRDPKPSRESTGAAHVHRHAERLEDRVSLLDVASRGFAVTTSPSTTRPCRGGCGRPRIAIRRP